MLTMRLKKIVQPKIKMFFDHIHKYSQKEATLLELEHELKYERELTLKTKILSKLSAHLGRRDNISQFCRSKELYTMKKALMSLKENLIIK